MPAHNEAGYLETAVTDVEEGLRARGQEHEILVVENGSTDDTLAIARRLADELPAVRVLTRAVADYGAALRDGILAAFRHFGLDEIAIILEDRDARPGPTICFAARRTKKS